MAFFSWQFILFLAVSLAVYYIVPGRFKWLVLLVSSAWYYVAGGGLKACIYVLVTIVTAYAGAVIIDNIQRQTDRQLKGRRRVQGTAGLSREEKRRFKSAGQKRKKAVLVIVLVINFGILVVLRYGNFLASNLNSLLKGARSSGHFSEMDFLIPLGLSFYTFQTMGYLIDVYRGKYAAERNILRLALFTTYFPSVLQGPINRFDDLGPRLFRPHKFDDQNFREGILRMLWGRQTDIPVLPWSSGSFSTACSFTVISAAACTLSSELPACSAWISGKISASPTWRGAFPNSGRGGIFLWAAG